MRNRSNNLALPELEGFRLKLLTTPDESGDGDLWLICPDGSHFGIAYDTGSSFKACFSTDNLWFASVTVACPMTTANGRVENLRALVGAFKPRYKSGYSRK